MSKRWIDQTLANQRNVLPGPSTFTNGRCCVTSSTTTWHGRRPDFLTGSFV